MQSMPRHRREWTLIYFGVGTSVHAPLLYTHIRRLKRRRMSPERFHVIRRRVMSRENFETFSPIRAQRETLSSPTIGSQFCQSLITLWLER